MKKCALFLAILSLPLVAGAQDYFKDGMEWVQCVSGMHEPNPVTVVETVTLDGDTVVDGMDALKMWVTNDKTQVRELVAVVRTEGDRVLFRNGAVTDGWRLMYDFGLQPGEGCYVYNVSDNLTRTYVKCVEVRQGACGGLDAMELEEYDAEPQSRGDGRLHSTGTWIRGLGSTRGVTWNNRFGVDGAGGMLLEASCGGEVVYHREVSSVEPVFDRRMNVRVDGQEVTVTGIDGHDAVSLFTLDGVLVRQFKKTGRDELRFVAQCSGLYIVKCGQDSCKIAVW